MYQPNKLHEISQWQLYREARLHTQMSHPNIVKLYAAFRSGDAVILVQVRPERKARGHRLDWPRKGGPRAPRPDEWWAVDPQTPWVRRVLSWGTRARGRGGD